MARNLRFRLAGLVSCLSVALIAGTSPAAGPNVQVVSAPTAPPLERLAADEMANMLRQLFDAQIERSATMPAQAQHVVLVGSPATNPAVKTLVGDRWPKLTDQGHLVQSVAVPGGDGVVVGGGSPIATLWAAYELAHHFGVRSLLSGDVLPAQPPTFSFKNIDLMLEPSLRLRTWRMVNDFPIGPESWGLADQQQLVKQLAKLKFNRVLISVYPWQPFVDYSFRGVKKQTGLLWYGYRYPVDGDTAGRVAFRGATEFTNPDFVGKTTYEQRVAAGTKLIRGIIDGAHELGMSAALVMSPLEFPREFAEAMPGAKTLNVLEKLAIGPGKQQPPDDPLLMELATTQIKAYLATYPTLDAIYLTLPEFPDWVEHHDQAWERLDRRTKIAQTVDMKQLTEAARTRNLIASGERGVQALRGNIAALDFFHKLTEQPLLFLRADGKPLELTVVDVDPALYHVLDKVLPRKSSALHFVDYTARRVAAHPDLLAEVPAKAVRSNLILTLADDNVGVLPQMSTTHLHRLLGQLRKNGWEGFSTRYWIVGDLSPSAYYLSRASFDERVTPEHAYVSLLDAISGEGVAARVIKGFQMIEEATDLIDQNDIGFTFPIPGVVMKHYNATTPPPAWWAQVRDLYSKAMDEMYRGNTRAREGSRSFTLYYAKRLEFAVHYMTSVEAVRKAGVARAAGNDDARLEELEKAVEAMYNALNAYGDVARDNCDRGVIAVLNEYGYRPLKAELEK